MRLVVQRVSQASVTVQDECVGAIGTGLLVLVAVSKTDSEKEADYLADKVTNLRLFPDETGKMNRSVLEIDGALLVISQFTLYGDCVKGRRPSFDQAAGPETAKGLYDYFVAKIRTTGLPVATGVFQADMQVTLTNSGPVTLIIDSK
jgi:D-tyrosyl-tRNA(Tyr) deacylase